MVEQHTFNVRVPGSSPGRLTILHGWPGSYALRVTLIAIWAGTAGHLDDVAVSKVGAFENGFLAFLNAKYRKTLSGIAKEKIVTPQIESQLKEAVAAFKKGFS